MFLNHLRFSSPEILKVHGVCVGVVPGGLVGHAELGDEARIAGALALEQAPVRVPLHDLLQHRGEEPAVATRLVLGAAGHGVGDVTEYPVIVDQSREVWGLQHVDNVDKLGGVSGVAEMKKMLN